MAALGLQSLEQLQQQGAEVADGFARLQVPISERLELLPRELLPRDCLPATHLRGGQAALGGGAVALGLQPLYDAHINARVCVCLLGPQQAR